MESFEINSFIHNKTIPPCLGENSPFSPPGHGHILLHVVIKLTIKGGLTRIDLYDTTNMTLIRF